MIRPFGSARASLLHAATFYLSRTPLFCFLFPLNQQCGLDGLKLSGVVQGLVFCFCEIPLLLLKRQQGGESDYSTVLLLLPATCCKTL